jgi:hypothetical protein
MYMSHEGARDLPASYPPEMDEWFACFRPNVHNKLGHDALLYLAEEGIRRLTTVAYSVYRGTYAVNSPDAEIDKRVGRALTFGQWPPLLQACLKSTGLWDPSSISSLTDCSRLAVARGHLKELVDARSVDPIVRALEQRDNWPSLDWWRAWQVVVDYRNLTLGHPGPRVVGATRFYEAMTPVVAAAVAELLWSPSMIEIFSRFPIARFEQLDQHDRYFIQVRNQNGYDVRQTLVGPEGATLGRD